MVIRWHSIRIMDAVFSELVDEGEGESVRINKAFILTHS